MRGSLFFFAVLSICLSGGSASAINVDFSKYFVAEENVFSEESKVFVSTHSTTGFDEKAVSAQGVKKAVLKAATAGFEITYVLGKPTEGASHDQTMAIYRLIDIANDRISFIKALEPFVTEQAREYFVPDIPVTRYIGSYAGGLSLTLPKMNQAVVGGGFLEVCLGQSINALLAAFAKSQEPVLKLYVVTDAIYVGACGIHPTDGIMTLRDCKARTDSTYVNQIQLLEKAAADKGLGITHPGEPASGSKKEVIFIYVSSDELVLH